MYLTKEILELAEGRVCVCMCVCGCVCEKKALSA